MSAITSETGYFNVQRISPGKAVDIVAYINTPKGCYKAHQVNTLDVMRDYNSNIGDILTLECIVSNGKFMESIQPYLDNLEVELNYMYNPSHAIRVPKDVTYKYKAVLLNQQDSTVGPFSGQSRASMDASGVRTLSFQLIELEVEAMRLAVCDGVHRDETLEDIVRSEIWQVCQDTNTQDGNLLDTGKRIDIYPFDNTEPPSHVTIPTGMNILDLPSWLQNKDFGCYNGNIGTYIQRYEKKADKDPKPRLFIYPLYNPKRYEERKDGESNKLIIVVPDNMNGSMSEYTMAINGDDIRILATDFKMQDSGENDFINRGGSFITNQPAAPVTGNVTPDQSGNGKVDADPTTSISGFKNKERRDGANKDIYLGNVKNLYKVRSSYLRSTMTQAMCNWKCCDMDMIYPGMPVMVLRFNSQMDIETRYGIVQGTFSHWDSINKNMSGIINMMIEKRAVYEEQEGKE